MIIERVVGTIIGGAIGDGWGRPCEGSVPRGPAAAPDELVVTDDTQLTLATCEAVVECGRVDPERIAGRFVAWFRAGRLHGLGASTLKAIWPAIDPIVSASPPAGSRCSRPEEDLA